MTAQSPAAGWYPDPSGQPGQKYWDGQQWQGATPAPAISHEQLGYEIRQAMAENRGIIATNAMALYSLLIGIAAILCNFLCGAGVLAAVPSVIVGIIALNRSKTRGGAGRGMAIGGIICGGAAFVFGVIVLMVIFGSMGSLQGPS